MSSSMSQERENDSDISDCDFYVNYRAYNAIHGFFISWSMKKRDDVYRDVPYVKIFLETAAT